MPIPRRLALLSLAVVLLAACGAPSSVTWRNVTIDVPEGWTVVEEEQTRFSIANAEPEEITADEAPEGPVVAMFFTFEPHAVPADWREYVEQQDATLESDRRIDLGDDDVPATRLVFSHTTNGVPTREMVVVIPSRGIVVLAQPVPRPGDTDAPEIFLDHIDVFMEVLETAEFGPPLLEP